MIDKNKLVRQFKINQFQNYQKKPEPDKSDNKTLGKTQICPVDVADMIAQISEDKGPDETVKMTASAAAPAGMNNDDKWDSTTKLRDFIVDTLRNAGIEPDDNLVNQIYIKIVESIISDSFIVPSIRMVTELIDINLVNADQSYTNMITALVDVLISSDNPNRTANDTTYGDVRNFILAAANELNPPTPPVEPDVPEPTVITTPEQAMQVLIDKMNSIVPNDNMSVEDFMLSVKNDASLYIQLKFGYDPGFADVLAMYFARIVDLKYAPESGLAKDADLDAAKARLSDLVQNMDFLKPHAWGLESYYITKGYDSVNQCYIDKYNPSWIDYVTPSWYNGGLSLHGNNDMGHNGDVDPCSGPFFLFLNEYFRETLCGGNLNQSQQEAIFTAIIKEFSGSNLNPPQAWFKSDRLSRQDINKNGNMLDDWYAAMMRVLERYPNVDTQNAQSIDYDIIFGSSDTLDISAIIANENELILSSDPGVRMLMAELFNSGRLYSIDPGDDYDDYLRAFVTVINRKCGITTDQNNPVLTRATFERYINENGMEGLRALLNSNEIRDEYYMQTYDITGEIGSFIQGPTYDCWFCSALISMNATEEGRAIFRDLFEVNADGSVTVHLKGGYVSNGRWGAACAMDFDITLTRDEIFNLRATGNYIKGKDAWSVAVLEMAISKVRAVKYEGTEYNGHNPFANGSGDEFLYAGQVQELLFYLTGRGDPGNSYGIVQKWPDSIPYDVWDEDGRHTEWLRYTRDDFRDKILEAIANGTINESNPIGNDGYYIVTIDMSQYLPPNTTSVYTASHACAVTRFTAEGLYFVNPYIGEESFVSWDDFIAGEVCGKISFVPYYPGQN